MNTATGRFRSAPRRLVAWCRNGAAGLALLACTPTPPELPAPPTAHLDGPIGAHLDSVLTPYVEDLRRRTDNDAGLAIGITSGGRVVYARAFGAAELARGEPATLETRFHLASVSKSVTAAAVLRLVADGQIDLDAPMVTYLPEFRIEGEGADRITVRHALAHTSGLPRDFGVDNWAQPVFGAGALEENLARARDARLVFTPGTAFEYSNAAYDVLGLLVERVSGVSFAEYVQANVLEPAGMRHASYANPRDSLPPQWARPYSYGLTTQEWAPFPFSGANTPSTGLHASVLDMCQWGLLHLARGRAGGQTVIEADGFEAMVSPQVATPWGEAMGLGWFLQTYEGHSNLMQLGNDTGFEAAMYIYPADDVSIVVLANRDFSRTGRLALAAAEILFGGEPKPIMTSARYPFAERMRTDGISAATAVWEALSADSTDRYQVDDDDLLSMGAVLENGGRWREARDVLQYFVSRHDNAPYPWRLLGNAHVGLRDTASAIAAYSRALAIDPTYARGRAALEAVRSR